MYDDEHDALAAEYVLGTLSAEERDQAEALLSIDSGFEASVRQWERRLGELNVMVEAVEPPPDVWERIKTGIAPIQPSDELQFPHVERFESEPSFAAALDSRLSEATAPEVRPVVALADGPPPTERKRVERGADVVHLARRARRWRRLTFLVGAIAAVLAVYVAVWQVAPERIPLQLRPPAAGMLARQVAPGASQPPQDRLVAVLQQEPTAPAFLLTVDTRNRTMVVRRVSATPETGRSYELWLISSRFSSPRSLGIVGSDEFTQRALPANYDADTLRTASYAVSLEPAGGSPSGVPTGPVLFTGNAVEAVPASQPAAPPRT